jgi:hypothetical protein
VVWVCVHNSAQCTVHSAQCTVQSGWFLRFFRSRFQILDLQSEEDSFRITSIPEKKQLPNLGQFLVL